jgi:hypothetical protein
VTHVAIGLCVLVFVGAWALARGSDGSNSGMQPADDDDSGADRAMAAESGGDRPAMAPGDGGASPMMSFFVTSTGSGAMGGNLGGLAGADMKCKMLVAAVGVGQKDWKAYLSTTAQGQTAAVNARERIGNGPWFNARGEMVAANLMALLTSGISADRVLDEKGAQVPRMHHDILTGSTTMGTPFMGRTCCNWTSSSNQMQSQVGHSDGNTGRLSAHASGCSEMGLRATSGNGRTYCFAAN